ncbi:MAG: SRPBCC family protein [Candidatus Bathyarchaeia archaeon]
MAKLTKSVEIEASPEKVWAFVNDPKKMNDAMKGWAEGEHTSKVVGVGATMHYVGVAGGSQAEWDMEVAEFVKDKKVAMRTIGASKFKMTNSWVLEPTTKGTKSTFSMEYEVPYSVLGKLVDKLKVSKDMEKSMSKMLENMKKALEA